MATFAPGTREATFKWDEVGGPGEDASYEVFQEGGNAVDPAATESSPRTLTTSSSSRRMDIEERMERSLKDIKAALDAEAALRISSHERLEERLREEAELRAGCTAVFEQRFGQLQGCIQQSSAGLFNVTEALEKQAGKITDLHEECMSPMPRGSLDSYQSEVSEVREELESERSGRTKEISKLDHSINELKLCLEAEVGARCAMSDRLSQQMQELMADRAASSKAAPKEPLLEVQKLELQSILQLTSRLQKLEEHVAGNDLAASACSKTSKESLQDAGQLQFRLQKLEDVENKLQMILERQGQSQGGSTLEVEVLSEGLKKLEVQAKKHVVWVEAQAEKMAARQEAHALEEAASRSTLEEELRQYIVTELSGQAKFFQGELKGIMSAAHSSWIDEIRKLWAALGQKSQDNGSADGSAAGKEAGKGVYSPDVPLSPGRVPKASPAPTPPPPFPTVGGVAVDAGRQPSLLLNKPESGSRVVAPPEASAGSLGMSPVNVQSMPQRPGSMMAARSGSNPGPGRPGSPRAPHPGTGGLRPSASHSAMPSRSNQSLEAAVAQARQSNTPTPEEIARRVSMPLGAHTPTGTPAVGGSGPGRGTQAAGVSDPGNLSSRQGRSGFLRPNTLSSVSSGATAERMSTGSSDLVPRMSTGSIDPISVSPYSSQARQGAPQGAPQASESGGSERLRPLEGVGRPSV